MKNTFNFTLVKPAKNLGGDRYSTILGNKEWTVYFPQEITRPAGHSVKEIEMNVNIVFNEKEVA